MERELGRYLLPHERVHHLNGQHNDNRPLKISNYGRLRTPPAFGQLIITARDAHVTVTGCVVESLRDLYGWRVRSGLARRCLSDVEQDLHDQTVLHREILAL